MTRKMAVLLQTVGMVLIVGMMLIDRYLLPIGHTTMLLSAIVSAVLLAVGIRVRHRFDSEQ